MTPAEMLRAIESGEIPWSVPENTVQSRRYALKPFMQYLQSIGIEDLQDVTPQIVRNYIKGRIQSPKNLRATTINNQMRIIQEKSLG